MVDAASDFRRIRYGIQCAAKAFRWLGSAVRSDPSQSAGNGHHWTKDDDKPAFGIAQVVVAATDGRDRNVTVRWSA